MVNNKKENKMGKEERVELAKFFLRLAEITFAVMIVAPTKGMLLKAKFPILFYIANLGVGFIGVWIFYAVAVKILKKKGE